MTSLITYTKMHPHVRDDSDELEILDLTQNKFNPEVRACLMAAGEKASVHVQLRKAVDQVLRTGRCPARRLQPQ